MKTEICANSFTSAKHASLGGANRIELCENLSVGGVTPSNKLIQRVKQDLDIEVHVLIRPRGGSFVYTEAEIQTMIASIEYCKQQGCAGIVSGALTPLNTIDISTTQRLIAASDGMTFTFHRAFDICSDPLSSFSLLKKLSIDRLLSSGQEAKAEDGIPLLKELASLSKNTIEIMPGSGISSKNALLFKEAGFSSIHLSAIKKDPKTIASDLFNSKVEGFSNLEEIKKVINILA